MDIIIIISLREDLKLEGPLKLLESGGENCLFKNDHAGRLAPSPLMD